MATFVWEMHDSNDGYQTIDATDIVGFYGASFDDPVEVDAWAPSTHIEDSGNVHQCVTYCGMKNQYISSDSIDIGAGTVDIDTLSADDGVLRISFSETDSTTSNATFWAYDGTTTTAAPTNIDFMCLEPAVITDAWVQAEGSGSAMSLADNATPASSHQFYIACSASPKATGDLEAFELMIQLTYQT